MDGRRAARVPGWLATASSWAGRLLVIGFAIYFGLRLVVVLWLVTIPLVVALLLSALLLPLTRALVALRMPRLLATWLTLLVAVALLAGAGTGSALLVQRQAGMLEERIRTAVRSTFGPSLSRSIDVDRVRDQALDWLRRNQGTVASQVFTGVRTAGEVLAAALLGVFVTFFYLYQGERIWSALLSPLRGEGRERVDRAGRAAWGALSGWIRGTFVIALIHAVVMGTVLWIMRVPLVAVLTLVFFLGSFIPIIGILIGGALSILITLGTRGWVLALVLLAVLLVEQQAEAHLLQPLVIGRTVRLHPLVVGLVIAVGGVLGGIVGALVAVPLTGVIWRAVPELRGPPTGGGDGDGSGTGDGGGTRRAEAGEGTGGAEGTEGAEGATGAA